MLGHGEPNGQGLRRCIILAVWFWSRSHSSCDDFDMNHGGYIFPVLLCLLKAEIVCSALLNTNIESSLGCVCNPFVKKISGRRLVLLVPECYEDGVLDGADCDVDISVSENKEIKLPLMILFQHQAIIY